MELKFIKKIIEALLFVCENPLTMKQVSEVLPEADSGEIRAALKELKEEYSDSNRGVQLFEIAGGHQFCTNPECGDYVKKLYKTRKVFRLSAPALETLAIIAYKQPVTRSEIEFIRGVNVDGVLKTLFDRDLVKEKGRKEVPGRPILFGTTEDFLQYFGLKSLQDLPALEDFAAEMELRREALEQRENTENTPGENLMEQAPTENPTEDPGEEEYQEANEDEETGKETVEETQTQHSGPAPENRQA